MKNLKPLLQTFAVGLAAAYGFAMVSAKYGPLPGLGHKVQVGAK